MITTGQNEGESRLRQEITPRQEGAIHTKNKVDDKAAAALKDVLARDIDTESARIEREAIIERVMSQIKVELTGIMGSASAADDIRRQCEQAIVESRCPTEGFTAYRQRTGHYVYEGEYERTKKATEKYFQQIFEIMLRYQNLKNVLERAIHSLPREQRGAFGILWATVNLALENIQTAYRAEDLKKADYALRLDRIYYAISEGERKIIKALKDLGLDLPKEK